MVRVYERSRRNLIAQANMNSIATLIKSKTMTAGEKRAMIAQRNPYFYVFGEKLQVNKGVENVDV